MLKSTTTVTTAAALSSSPPATAGASTPTGTAAGTGAFAAAPKGRPPPRPDRKPTIHEAPENLQANLQEIARTEQEMATSHAKSSLIAVGYDSLFTKSNRTLEKEKEARTNGNVNVNINASSDSDADDDIVELNSLLKDLDSSIAKKKMAIGYGNQNSTGAGGRSRSASASSVDKKFLQDLNLDLDSLGIIDENFVNNNNNYYNKPKPETPKIDAQFETLLKDLESPTTSTGTATPLPTTPKREFRLCDNGTCSSEAKFLCARCNTAAYCCRDCQVESWATHKSSCNSSNNNNNNKQE